MRKERVGATLAAQQEAFLFNDSTSKIISLCTNVPYFFVGQEIVQGHKVMSICWQAFVRLNPLLRRFFQEELPRDFSTKKILRFRKRSLSEEIAPLKIMTISREKIA